MSPHSEDEDGQRNPDRHKASGLGGGNPSAKGQLIGPEIFDEDPDGRIENDVEQEKEALEEILFPQPPEDEKDDYIKPHFVQLGRMKGLPGKHLACRGIGRVNHSPWQVGGITMGVAVQKTGHSANGLTQDEGRG